MTNRRSVVKWVAFLIGIKRGIFSDAYAKGGSTAPNNQFNVVKYGALGRGESHNDRPAIQSAIDAAYEAGGGVVSFPWLPTMNGDGFYCIDYPLIMRPRVSLVGDSPRPKIKNIRESGGISYQECLLPGNFHPDFTEDILYFDCGQVRSGNSVSLQHDADAKNFKIGDQVFVCSKEGGKTGNFFVPYYAYNNIIVDIVGAKIFLRENIDVNFEGKIGKPSSVKGRRDIPLFFAQDCSVENLEFLPNGYTWINDSSTLRVSFKNLKVTSSRAIYGNTFQHTSWMNCDFNFSRVIGEQSHNSFRTSAENCSFTFEKSLKENGSAGISIQEFARFISYSNCKILMNGFDGKNSVITTINAQDVSFKGIDVKLTSDTFSGGNLIAISCSRDPKFPSVRCVVDSCNFDASGFGRYLFLNGNSIVENSENGVKDCVFQGSPKQADAVRIYNSPGKNFLLRNSIVFGRVFLSNSSGARVIGNKMSQNVLKVNLPENDLSVVEENSVISR